MARTIQLQMQLFFTLYFPSQYRIIKNKVVYGKQHKFSEGKKKMNIEIRRLTPDLAEDYARFFDVTPHNVNTNSGKCYCVTWRSDDSYVGNGDHWFPTCEERRSAPFNLSVPVVCRATSHIAATRSWAGATQMGIAGTASIICVLIGP